MEKRCIECSERKELELFVRNRNLCKECMKIYKRKHREQNKEILKEKASKYYENNKESIKERVAEHYENNKEQKLEYQKEYAEKNKEKISKYKKEHSKKNKENITKYKSDYQRNRRLTDPVFKLNYSVGRLIRNSLRCKGLSKNKKSKDILGCDIEFFKSYLEERFTDDMTWENYGIVWDIDHKIPLATADTEDKVLELNHYTNLQPLDSYINRNVKKDRLDYE